MAPEKLQRWPRLQRAWQRTKEPGALLQEAGERRSPSAAVAWVERLRKETAAGCLWRGALATAVGASGLPTPLIHPARTRCRHSDISAESLPYALPLLLPWATKRHFSGTSVRKTLGGVAAQRMSWSRCWMRNRGSKVWTLGNFRALPAPHQICRPSAGATAIVVEPAPLA